VCRGSASVGALFTAPLFLPFPVFRAPLRPYSPHFPCPVPVRQECFTLWRFWASAPSCRSRPWGVLYFRTQYSAWFPWVVVASLLSVAGIFASHAACRLTDPRARANRIIVKKTVFRAVKQARRLNGASMAWCGQEARLAGTPCPWCEPCPYRSDPWLAFYPTTLYPPWL